MALNFLLKRSGTADKRPDPSSMALGELDLNYDATTGGVFYKDSDGNISKVGSAQVSATAPNATPVGSSGNSTGEFWYDTSASQLKIWSGTTWVSVGGGGGGGVAGVTGTSPITVDNTDPANPVVAIDSASTTGAGAVQLNDNIDSTSTTEAATSNAVKTAYDAAVAAQGAADAAVPDASYTALGDILSGTGGGTYLALSLGTDGNVLTADSACAGGVKWAAGGGGSGTVTDITAGTGLTGGTITTSGTIALDTSCVIAPSTLTAKGDLITASAASTPTALPVGTDGQVLSANSACASGLEWVAAGGGGGGTAATPTAAGVLYGCMGETTGPYQFSTVLGCSTATQAPLFNSIAIGDQVWTGTVGSSGGVIIGNCVGCLSTGVGTISDVVFIGDNAACCITTTASGSVVVGTDAGRCAGNNNTYVGRGAATASQGCRNTAVGCGALNGAGTTASALNTALGAIALNTTGSCNTALGAGAGNTGSSVTGNNNTFVGFGAVALANSCSNHITLGNNQITTIRAQVTSITSLSDARDKTDIVALPIGLDFVNAINPVKFTWQMREPNEVKDGTSETGFVAQELKAVEEQFDTTGYLKLVEGTEERLEASPGKLLPVLVKAIQELSAKNDALEARIAALEGN